MEGYGISDSTAYGDSITIISAHAHTEKEGVDPNIQF